MSEKNSSERADSILKTGWYYISEQETNFKKQLDRSSETYFINPELIIPIEQFDEIEIVENKYNGKEYLTLLITLNEKGTESWSIATKKAIGSKLALIINDKLVSVPKVNAQITVGISSLNRSEYAKQDLEGFLEQIEDEQKLNRKDISNSTIIKLPPPQMDGNISVEKVLNERRSRRQFLDKAISIENLSQILWAAYGVTYPISGYPSLKGGLHTAPSAGGLYPLEIYIVVGKGEGIEPGVYKYIPKGHKIEKIINKDIRIELCSAALEQKIIKEAPVSIVYTAVFSRMTNKYGERGRERYVCMDLGHSAENIYLQVETLGLGTCAVGAFIDDKIAEILKLPKEEEPLYIMPIGHYVKQK